MLISEARKRKVVSANMAETLGLIDTFAIDPVAKRVAAIALSKVTAELTLLPWSNIETFGDDAVIVPGITALVAPEGPLGTLADKDHSVLRKRVLDTAGRDLGTVHDVDIDPVSGVIVLLILERYQIPGQALIGIGSYAVIVAAA